MGYAGSGVLLCHAAIPNLGGDNILLTPTLNGYVTICTRYVIGKLDIMPILQSRHW